MPSERFLSLPAVRKQQLLVEFASLKYVCPSGVYVSLTPGDPAKWVGVMFIRKGPYAPAILRFRVTFPSSYPSLPPSVTFNIDLFHPLLTPLTTYTYTTSSTANDTVSATDEERLPPGGFSLRHGFPQWFGRSKRKAGTLTTPPRQPSRLPRDTTDGDGNKSPSPTSAPSESPGSEGYGGSPSISIVRVLHYIRSCFDDESVLDSIPLEAAANTGAWHARKTYLRKSTRNDGTNGMEHEDLNGNEDNEKRRQVPGTSTPTSMSSARKPGEWNWEGVWEERVKKGIEGSLAEPVLYGNAAGGDDIIRFLNMDKNMAQTIQENVRRTVELAGSK